MKASQVFFDFIGLAGGTVEECAKALTEWAKENRDWFFPGVLRFVEVQKEMRGNYIYMQLKATKAIITVLCYGMEQIRRS